MNARQRLFDLVVPHAAKMEKSENESGICRYRGPEGRKCFIGVGIPDDKYTPDMELRGCTKWAFEAAGLDLSLDVPWGRQLQRTHDHNPPEAWERLLRKFAKEWKMTWPT